MMLAETWKNAEEELKTMKNKAAEKALLKEKVKEEKLAAKQAKKDEMKRKKNFIILKISIGYDKRHIYRYNILIISILCILLIGTIHVIDI